MAALAGTGGVSLSEVSVRAVSGGAARSGRSGIV